MNISQIKKIIGVQQLELSILYDIDGKPTKYYKNWDKKNRRRIIIPVSTIKVLKDINTNLNLSIKVLNDGKGEFIEYFISETITL